MSAAALALQDELRLDHRRRTRNAALASLALHVGLIVALAWTPPLELAPMPAVLSVDLVAALPGPSAAKPAPRAAPAARPEPKAPAPAPPVAKPVPKAPVQVLPEETPGRIQKARVQPQAPEPAAKPEPAARRPPREKELSYDDAMAALGEELGGDETADLLQPAPSESAPVPDASSGERGGSRGAIVDPELAAWNQATRRHIQNKWVTPAQFRGQGLATVLELRLSANGDVLGEPRVARSSGNPFYDDNTVRAVLMASPLPAPPKPGRRVFVFRSELQ